MDILENYNISLNLKRKPLFVGEEYRIRHFFISCIGKFLMAQMYVILA